MIRLLYLLLLFACLSIPNAVLADGEDPQEELAKAAATETGSGWLLGGGVAVTDPGYVGFSRQVTPLPLIFYHYGRLFFAGISAGYLVSDGGHYRLALVVQPTLNRLKSSDSPQLAGIQSRQWSLAGGASLETFGGWGRLKLGLFHDLLDRNNGTSANLDYRFPFRTGDWTLSPGIGLRWQDSNLTDYYYGVNPAEARPGRPAYSPASAASPYVSFGVATSMSAHWQFRGDISYQRFGSAIHNSPIVDRSGSPTLFVGFIYDGFVR